MLNLAEHDEKDMQRPITQAARQRTWVQLLLGEFRIFRVACAID